MPPAGKRLAAVGNYRLERRVLGRGTFAKVELATHTILETKVALKIMWRSTITDNYVLRNLMREANILARLRHPNVVRLIEICDDGKDLFCLVLEYVEGGTLFELVFEKGKLEEPRAKSILKQLARAIAFLHRKGFVHRDLKMENVMIDRRADRVVVVDFGLSNLWHPNKRLMTHCGSAEYAAPELFVRNSTYGPSIDVWSFGVIAFATLLGFLPFQRDEERDSMRALKSKIAKGLTCDHLKHMSKLTTDARLLIMRALDVNRRTRMQSAQLEIDVWFGNDTNNDNNLDKESKDGEFGEDEREVAEKLRQRFNPRMTVEQILGHVRNRSFARTAGCFNIMCLQNERQKADMDNAFIEENSESSKEESDDISDVKQMSDAKGEQKSKNGAEDFLIGSKAEKKSLTNELGTENGLKTRNEPEPTAGLRSSDEFKRSCEKRRTDQKMSNEPRTSNEKKLRNETELSFKKISDDKNLSNEISEENAFKQNDGLKTSDNEEAKTEKKRRIGLEPEVGQLGEIEALVEALSKVKKNLTKDTIKDDPKENIAMTPKKDSGENHQHLTKLCKQKGVSSASETLKPLLLLDKENLSQTKTAVITKEMIRINDELKTKEVMKTKYALVKSANKRNPMKARRTGLTDATNIVGDALAPK